MYCWIRIILIVYLSTIHIQLNIIMQYFVSCWMIKFIAVPDQIDLSARYILSAADTAALQKLENSIFFKI